MPIVSSTKYRRVYYKMMTLIQICVFSLFCVFARAGNIPDQTCFTSDPVRKLDGTNDDAFLGSYIDYVENPATTITTTFGRVVGTGSGEALEPGNKSIESQSYSDNRYVTRQFLSVEPGNHRVGAFFCNLHLDEDPSYIPTIILASEAYIKPEKQTQTVSFGETVTLRMNLLNGNVADLRWRLNENVMESWSGMVNVTIQNVTKTDAGIYECYLMKRRSEGKHAIMRLIVRGCSASRWGPDCQNLCPTCYNGGVCDDVTGLCVCRPGFKATDCSFGCGNNNWGRTCSWVCSSDNPGCPGALGCVPDPVGCSCMAGYKGLDCKDGCVTGRYGSTCSEECHCATGVQCDSSTGCPDGPCADGYSGKNCRVPAACPGGWYGELCKYHCHCEDDGPCDRSTGSCGERKCRHLWLGSDCQLYGRTNVNLIIPDSNQGDLVTITCVVQANPIPNEEDIHVLNNDDVSLMSGVFTVTEDNYTRTVVYSDVSVAKGDVFKCQVSSNVTGDALAEKSVTVYPCQPGSYGYYCNLNCNCESASCHQETGCDGGCVENWLPNSCTTGIIASTNMKVNPGQTSTFQCYVQGDVTDVNIQLFIGSESAEEIENTETDGVTRVTFSGEATPSLAYSCRIAKDSEIVYWDHSINYFNLPTYTGTPSSLSVTGSSVELSWREWSNSDGDLGDPLVVGYVVHYKKASSSEAWSSTPQVTNPTARVTGLHWEEEYTFAVAAVREGAGGEGPRGSEVLTTSTICGEPSAPEVSTGPRSEKTINILWQQLTETESKCTTGVEQYTITYRPVNTDVSMSLTKGTTSTSYTIMELEIYTEYVISVAARNKDADGTVRVLQEFSPEEKPPVPGVSTKHEGSFLTVSVYPSDSFSRNLYGNINGYEVRYRSRDSDEWKNQSITEGHGGNRYKITSVEDVDYEVSARVINGAGIGNWSPFFIAEQCTGSSNSGFVIAIIVLSCIIIFIISLAFGHFYRYHHPHGNNSIKCRVQDNSLKTKTVVAEKSNELDDYANTVPSSASIYTSITNPIQQDIYDVIETETQITDGPNGPYEMPVTHDDVIPSTSKDEITTEGLLLEDARVTEDTKEMTTDSANKANPVYTNL